MRGALASACTLLTLLFLWPASASAQHIPPGKEREVLNLFSPFSVDAPTDRVGSVVLLDSVSIEREAIRTTLVKGDAKAVVLFGKKGMGPETLLDSSLSFDIWSEGELQDPELKAAAGELVAAFKKNDTEPFWAAMPVSPEQDQPGAMSAPAAPGFLWYDFVGEFLILALLVLFAMTGGSLATRFKGLPRYVWVGIAVSVALGGAYRHSLSQAKVQK